MVTQEEAGMEALYRTVLGANLGAALEPISPLTLIMPPCQMCSRNRLQKEGTADPWVL